jgi:hypothetical protein
MAAGSTVDIAAIERRLKRAAQQAEERFEERDQAMRELARHGVTRERIGEIAGLTKGRVSQVLKKGHRQAVSVAELIDPENAPMARKP